MRNWFFLLLISPAIMADPVLLKFTPPSEYEDGGILADSSITEYKWEAYGQSATLKDNLFPNTGNMTEVTIELPADRYLICLSVKAGLWSKLRCTYVNMFEPKPPLMC